MTTILFDLICSIVGLATKPLSLIKLSCVFGARSIFIVIQTWIELLRAAISLHLIIFWKLAVWTIAIVSLPMRVINALHRERTLELHLHEMRSEVENVLWDRKELEGQLFMAVKKLKTMEMMLRELEGEHDEAIVRIQLLEREVQDLKDENERLREVHGKALWSHRDEQETHIDRHTKDIYKHPDQVKIHEPIREDKGLMSSGPHIILQDSEIIVKRRELALSRTLFSAILSLVVGMIVWEANDPCVPLVVALFTVVGMSLISVVQFFATIDNKPASDAVALLSMNWFILGTLAYPTLPRLAHLLAPLTWGVVERTLVWFSLL